MTFPRKGPVRVSFTAHTIYGEVRVEKVVEI